MADDVSDRTERRIRLGQTVRIVVLVVVAAVLVVWAGSNTQDVEVDWLFDTTTNSLVVVIVGAALLGFLIGLFVAWRRRR
jgi:uncharacterized integral membrane protein